MNNASTVQVTLPGRTYDIEIGAGVLAKLPARLAALVPSRRVTIVTDSNVAPLHAAKLTGPLESAGIGYTLIAVPAGEHSKSLQIASEVFDVLAEDRHGRDEPIIALGGGMVGDLAGLAAATWLRGVPFVQCPTTLEADVDASVGGKTAVNHTEGKNLIGAFHQPVHVCIDVDCLDTLSERDFRAGLAESVKHAVIADPEFLTWHEANYPAIRERTPEVIAQLIRRNCEIKASFVVADEREESTRGVGRAALNFGHTIAHAIEAESHYSLRHGEAVALGMVAELWLAVRLLQFPEDDFNRIERLLAVLGFDLQGPVVDRDAVLARLAADKKARNRNLRFVLPQRLGQMVWLEAPQGNYVETAVARVIRKPL